MKKLTFENIILLNSCLLVAVGLFSFDLINPSLPAIAIDLGVGQAIARSLAVAYLLGFGVSQLIYGPLSDRYGRRKIIFVSLALALLGNLFTAYATSANELLGWRFVTGFGAGGCPVIARAILSDTFKDKIKLTHAFAIFATASQLSPAIAPIIGGFIQQHYSWHPNFIFLAVFCFVALITLLLSLPETAFKDKSSPNNNLREIFSGYGHMILNRTFMLNCLMSAIVLAYSGAYYTASPFVFQHEFGLSPAWNGMVYVFYALGIVIGARTIKSFTHLYTPEKIVFTAMSALVLVTMIMPLIHFFIPSLIMFLLFTFIIAILCGISAPILMSLSIHAFTHIGGTVSAMQGAIKMLGGGLILFVLLIVHVDSTVAMGLMFAGTSILLLICLLFNFHSRTII